MKNLVVFIGLFGLSFLASAVDEALCRTIVPTLSGHDEQIIEQLYTYKQRNQDQWRFHGLVSTTPYTLEPTDSTIYKVSWTVKNKSINKKHEGKIQCDIPTAWSLSINAPVTIAYPPSTHGINEESLYQKISTIAGIYLGKSKYAINPDTARIMWHLTQEQPSQGFIDIVIKEHSFLNREQLYIINNNLDQTNHVQLIALHISGRSNINEGNQLWLVTNADDQRAIRENRYTTETSPHNKWLPWFDGTSPEFAATTAQDAYKTTLVAPLAQAKIYNRASLQFVPDPIAVIDKMQSVYDIIAPLAHDLINGESPLFAHLVLQNGPAFELVTVEIFQHGEIKTLSMEHLVDPSQIGLPGAHALGFFTP